jgi:hypothetical protein
MYAGDLSPAKTVVLFLEINPRDEVAIKPRLRRVQAIAMKGTGFSPYINLIHKFLEINPRGEVAIKSLTHSPFARQIH